MRHSTTSSIAILLAILFLLSVPTVLTAQTDTSESQWEALPILSYDSDAGFGYGVKTMLVDLLGGNESFDVVLFNSTNGERWYQFVASYPDIERRQGTVYPFAADLTVDIDTWISNSFFGIGSRSKSSDREQYTRAPIELSLIVSRGFTPFLAGQIGFRHRSIRNSNLAPDGALRNLSPALNRGTAVMNCAVMSLRFDTRNSVIRPSSGTVLSGEAEQALDILGANTGYTKVTAVAQWYRQLFSGSVAAFRLRIQTIAGRDLPVQTLLSVGGTNTARGFPQDRFLDRSSAVANAEWRFPLLWRFGGVLGADAGRVASSPGRMDFNDWGMNGVAGLRLHMETFVVRLDIGVSREKTGFYLNFGELF